jgi:hypothetical protein
MGGGPGTGRPFLLWRFAGQQFGRLTIFPLSKGQGIA